MFTHPEEDYDFVVKLQPAVLPRYFQNVTANAIWADKHTSDPSADGEVPLRPGFDPVEVYLDDLTVCNGAFSVTVLRLTNSSSVSMLTQPSFSTIHWVVIGLALYGTLVSPSLCHSAC